MPEMRALSGAREHRVFASRLDPHRIGMAERAIIRVAKAPFGDFRDWDGISAWVREIAEALRVLH